MSGEKAKQSTPTSSRPVVTTTTASSNIISPRQRVTQNFMLIWLDAGINKANEDCQKTMVQLQSVIDDVHIFTQRDECIDFLTEVTDKKIFLIIAGTLGQQILPLLYDIPQLDGVYIFCSNKSSHEEWTKKWVKVKSIDTEITSICKSIQQAVQQFNQDSIAVSFVTVNQGASSVNLDQLEPSFMYTQIFKEILLEMKHDESSIKNFTAYCRSGDYGSPTNITQFENSYNANLAIYWYTYPSFIYSLLNGALRMLEADTIINMGFFIHDLHNQIKQLHQEQVSNYERKSFIVYHGQGLSTTDFEKLRKTKGGLMSFNNFLSTSTTREVSLGFVECALGETDKVGIIFQMFIDSSISSAPFASIDEVSYFHTEEEILFSMHTVFRIDDIKQIDKNNPLYQIDLTITSDDDPQLRMVTESIRAEAGCGTGWDRLSTLLMKIGQFDMAEELYTVLLKQTFDEGQKALYYVSLGYVKNDQGDYEKAIWYYEKGLEIYEKTLPPNHPDLATSYNNIGTVYDTMGEYSKALSYYEKALEIYQKTLPPNHPSLAISYNNIGSVYYNMGEYSKALSYYEEALEIRQKTLPPHYPLLATSYNNIGTVYYKMDEYSKALSSHEKALEIRQKPLPPNHPSLATSYNNIGTVYNKMGEYSKALSYYEKALEIRQKTLPPNHPSLATSYNNIGSVYYNMGEYSKAISFLKRALDIWQCSLPANHPDLQAVRKWIEIVKNKL
jgi:tetratricopeptide (TPR) repeat protein